MRASIHLQVVFMSGLSEVVLCLCLYALMAYLRGAFTCTFTLKARKCKRPVLIVQVTQRFGTVI